MVVETIFFEGGPFVECSDCPASLTSGRTYAVIGCKVLGIPVPVYYVCELCAESHATSCEVCYPEGD